MLLVIVTAMSLPTLEDVNTPDLVRVTFETSPEITPTKVPAVTDASVVLS